VGAELDLRVLVAALVLCVEVVTALLNFVDATDEGLEDEVAGIDAAVVVAGFEVVVPALLVLSEAFADLGLHGPAAASPIRAAIAILKRISSRLLI